MPSANSTAISRSRRVNGSTATRANCWAISGIRYTPP
ncbi:hypothetical protein YPPY72_4599, partial [Yersinia pestis PY-72]